MKVQSEMCETCPWRQGHKLNREIRKLYQDINKIHICHSSYKNWDWLNNKEHEPEGRQKRCKGSYLWRKKQFKDGAIRLAGNQKVVK